MIQESINHTYQLYGNTVATIRPIRKSDVEQLIDLHNRLSDESLFMRFLRLYRPSVKDMQFIVNMPVEQGAGVVATIQSGNRELIIGMAYYVHENRYEAEPAFVVDDWYHGQGLGSKLFEMLTETAVSNNVELFKALVHTGNKSMTRVFERSNLPMQTFIDYGQQEIHIRLQPTVADLVFGAAY